MFRPIKSLSTRRDIQTFVHPEIDEPIVVRWQPKAWTGVALQGNVIFKTSLKHLLETGWIQRTEDFEIIPN